MIKFNINKTRVPILTVGTLKVHFILNSVNPSKLFIFHNMSSLSDKYTTDPDAVLKVAFCKSFGTGTNISTLFAMDLFLKLDLALTLYSYLLDDGCSILTSTHIKGFNYIDYKRNPLLACLTYNSSIQTHHLAE